MEAGRSVKAVLKCPGCSIHPSPTVWWCNAKWRRGKIVDLMFISSSLIHHPNIALSSNGSGYKDTDLGMRVRILPEQLNL